MYNISSTDPCDIDRSPEYPQWKCLERDVKPSSFIVLYKGPFYQVESVPLVGTDIAFSENDECTLDLVSFGYPWNDVCNPIEFTGADAGLASIAAFTSADGRSRAAGISKSGMFYVFDLLNQRQTVVSRKIGPWSSLGGGQFSMAVSEEYQIGVAQITGGTGVYASRLADGREYCGGVIHGMDLETGKTLYQIPNPWAIPSISRAISGKMTQSNPIQTRLTTT